MELVAQTDNGLRAEELITKFQPDVVVLDLVLPNLDGLSLLTHLRAKNASSRVIVTSAICNDQVLMECAELGTTYFMQKPFDPSLLVQRIRQTARPRQRAGGTGTQLTAAEPEPSHSLTHPSPRPRSRASSPTSSTRSACPRTSRATSTCARRFC